MRKPVYIIHPIKGRGRPGEIAANKLAIESICREIREKRPDLLPISPLHNCLAFLNDEGQDPTVRPAAISYSADYLEMVYYAGGIAAVFGAWETSEQSQVEMRRATFLGMRLQDGAAMINPEQYANDMAQAERDFWETIKNRRENQ